MKILDGLTRRGLITGAATLAAASLAGPALARAPMRNTPAPAFYRFKLGEFEVTVVSDGPLNLGEPTGDVFKGLSKEEMVQTLANHYLPTNGVKLDQNAVVINTGPQLVLIDTGTGPTIKAFGPDAGRLPTNLKVAGIDPKSVDAILITHAHPDHCFGLMNAKAARIFPKARICMTEADFNFFTDESKASINDMMRMLIDGARKSLLPNRDRIVFIKDGQEVVPGIQAMLTPGHTVGHTSFMITSQGQSLFNTGDICHHHIISTEKPRVPFSFDTDGQQGVASRLKAFDMLSSTRTPMLAYHFPWPGIGYIGKQGDAYRYFPAPLRTVL
jgi:glyoxylase-like metal-dependent hydrolase (beta-lactamase superfamily II)